MITAFAGFGIRSNALKGLQRTGVKTSATVVFVDTRSIRDHYPEIEVRYADLRGHQHLTMIPVGERANYQLGETVDIAYSRTNPSDAVFAHGYTDLGPIAVIFFLALCCGLTWAVICGLSSRRLTRGLRLVKHHIPIRATVSYQLRRNGPQGILSIQSQPGRRLVMRSVPVKTGWSEQENPAWAFGEIRNGKVVVIATTTAISIGRLRRPK